MEPVGVDLGVLQQPRIGPIGHRAVLGGRLEQVGRRELIQICLEHVFDSTCSRRFFQVTPPDQTPYLQDERAHPTLATTSSSGWGTAAPVRRRSLSLSLTAPAGGPRALTFAGNLWPIIQVSHDLLHPLLSFLPLILGRGLFRALKKGQRTGHSQTMTTATGPSDPARHPTATLSFVFVCLWSFLSLFFKVL
ncbi:hypothetical protein [Kribbella sp. NPDC000426]|uniref:hypothetical protein n=1 Tax=Kribbella sp. NPDC000426 TaxID=3154255 RepID=UPI0033260183